MEKKPSAEKSEFSFRQMKEEKYGAENSKGNRDFNIDSKVFRLGQKLKSIRLSYSLTQQELADRIGTQKSYISKIENGSDMNVSTLIRICEHGFKKPIYFVFGEIVD